MEGKQHNDNSLQYMIWNNSMDATNIALAHTHTHIWTIKAGKLDTGKYKVYMLFENKMGGI